VVGSGTSLSLHDLYIMSTTKLWLERSRNYPLSVRVLHVPVGRVPDPRSAQLLAMLIPEARRWRHVQFIIPAANMASLRQHLPKGFPALQTLTLQMKGLWNSEPSLDILNVDIPWHQLTTLDLQVENNNLPTLDECLDILSKTENITRCTLSADCVLSDKDVHRDALSLPTLEEFHLILQGDSDTQPQVAERPEASLIHFLGLTSTPNLRTLRLDWLLGGPRVASRLWSPSHPLFLSFLRSISSTLQSFAISYLPLSERELMECLKLVPKVTHLDLRFSLSDQEHDPITDNLLSSLTLHSAPTADRLHTRPRSGEQPLLPFIQHFNIQCHGERLSNAVLIAMIHSRWQHMSLDAEYSPPSRLAMFRLLSMKPVIGEVVKRVRLWSQEGLDISIDSLIIR